MKAFLKFLLAGALIQAPFYLLFFLLVSLSQMICALMQKVLWQPTFGELSWFAASGLTLVFFAGSSFLLGFLYYSEVGKKLKFPKIIDAVVGRIPIIKIWWQPGHLPDFSKIKVAHIKSPEGVWREYFLMQKWMTPDGRILTRALRPSFPFPFTGFQDLLNESDLKDRGMILYLKTPASKIVQAYLSFGMITPKIEYEEEN